MVNSQNPPLPISFSLAMNEIARSALKKKRDAVRVLTAISEVPFRGLLGDFEEIGIELNCEEVLHEESFQLWNCTAARRLRSLNNYLLTGSFYVLQNGSSIFFITGERRPFFSKIIIPMSHSAFPRLLRVYLLTQEIYQLLNDFSKTKRIPLRYDEFYYKKMFGEAFTVKRHEKRAKLEEYGFFNEAFNEAREQGGWLDRISILEYKFRFSIARNGVLKFKKGPFSEYYDFFLRKIVDLNNERWKVFEKRSREEQPEREVKPILVEFDSEIFAEISLKKQFLQEIEKYPNSSYSVIHGGNPHLYISVLDTLDNSSFSLRTYDTNTLLISPQIRTTKAALVRFTKHLMKNFQEAKMADLQT